MGCSALFDAFFQTMLKSRSGLHDGLHDGTQLGELCKDCCHSPITAANAMLDRLMTSLNLMAACVGRPASWAKRTL